MSMMSCPAIEDVPMPGQASGTSGAESTASTEATMATYRIRLPDEAGAFQSVFARFIHNNRVSLIIDTLPGIGTFWRIRDVTKHLIPTLRQYTIDTDDVMAVREELMQAVHYPGVHLLIDVDLPILSKEMEELLLTIVHTVPTIVVRRV